MSDSHSVLVSIGIVGLLFACCVSQAVGDPMPSTGATNDAPQTGELAAHDFTNPLNANSIVVRSRAFGSNNVVDISVGGEDFGNPANVRGPDAPLPAGEEQQSIPEPASLGLLGLVPLAVGKKRR